MFKKIKLVLKFYGTKNRYEKAKNENIKWPKNFLMIWLVFRIICYVISLENNILRLQQKKRLCKERERKSEESREEDKITGVMVVI